MSVMKTEDFLNLLEQRELLPPRIVGKVRDKLRRGSHRLTSKALLKYLVQKKVDWPPHRQAAAGDRPGGRFPGGVEHSRPPPGFRVWTARG